MYIIQSGTWINFKGNLQFKWFSFSLDFLILTRRILAQISQCFLGRDRAFRTYHFLHHFSAIFIESPNKSDIHFFECEKPTPIEKIELEYSKAESQSIDTDQKGLPLNEVEKIDKETIIDRLLACSGMLLPKLLYGH